MTRPEYFAFEQIPQEWMTMIMERKNEKRRSDGASYDTNLSLRYSATPSTKIKNRQISNQTASLSKNNSEDIFLKSFKSEGKSVKGSIIVKSSIAIVTNEKPEKQEKDFEIQEEDDINLDIDETQASMKKLIQKEMKEYKKKADFKSKPSMLKRKIYYS